MKKTRHLTAQQAADTLGVSAATLYAYVSRGLIRSEAIEGDARTRYYNAEDIRRLKDRKAQRRNPAEAARQALHWGTPILESALTLITDGGLYYRGQDVLGLALTSSVEEVAGLLWEVPPTDIPALFAQPPIDVSDQLATLPADLPVINRMQIALALGGAIDLAAYDLSDGAVARTGARILRLVAAVAANREPGISGIVETLAAGWSRSDDESQSLLRAALILCADHELNVSSFTARVTASADAQPYVVVSAGLAAMQGAKHGGSTQRAEAMLREIGGPERAGQAIAARLRRGEMIPGFHHPLYPDGDPRARLLLGLLRDAFPGHPVIILADAVAGTMLDSIGLLPNVDFSLATLSMTLDLPPDSALSLFAIGRTIGWIGHALEQYPLGQLIRPRAAYIGVPIVHNPQE